MPTGKAGWHLLLCEDRFLPVRRQTAMYLFFCPSPSLGSLSLNPPGSLFLSSQTLWDSYTKMAGKPCHFTNYHLTLTFLTKVNTTSLSLRIFLCGMAQGPFLDFSEAHSLVYLIETYSFTYCLDIYHSQICACMFVCVCSYMNKFAQCLWRPCHPPRLSTLFFYYYF